MVEIQQEDKYAKYGLVRWFRNLKNTKKNWGKVKASPYASLVFALKARKLIVGLLIFLISIQGWNLINNFDFNKPMGKINAIISVILLCYICFRIYSTIPAAKKQIEYYKKYPHLINYCPTDTKQDIDDILNKINQNKQKEVTKNV
jgi:amino acid permease